MAKGIIIAGFATCGKTYLAQKYDNIIDMESGYYKYDYSGYEDIPYEKRKGMPNRKINSKWPNNYYLAISKMVEEYNIVFVQLTPSHLKYFDENNIEYYIAYPSINDWNFVEERCIQRGNNLEWIKRLKNVFYEYFEISKKSNCKKILIVDRKNSLEDVLKKERLL